MLIKTSHLDKSFLLGGRPYFALKNVGLEVGAGELVFVVGKSGSGKSTLLNMIAGIDRPSAGTVHVAGHAVHELNQDELARFRGQNVGVIFQFFQLLPTLTVAENVMLAMDLVGSVPSADRQFRAMQLLQKVGVGDQADKLPTALSGGQQQRVAIARALANDPPLVLADEPTGNLDSRTAAQVMSLFNDLVAAGKTVLVVTHDADLTDGGRVITIADGAVA